MKSTAIFCLTSLLTCGLLWTTAQGVEPEKQPLDIARFALPGTPAPVPQLKLWSVPSAQKVFREDDHPGTNQVALLLEAAANETEALQLVLRVAGADLVLTNAAVGEFKQTNGAAPFIRAQRRFLVVCLLRAASSASQSDDPLGRCGASSSFLAAEAAGYKRFSLLVGNLLGSAIHPRSLD